MSRYHRRAPLAKLNDTVQPQTRSRLSWTFYTEALSQLRYPSSNIRRIGSAKRWSDKENYHLPNAFYHIWRLILPNYCIRSKLPYSLILIQRDLRLKEGHDGFVEGGSVEEDAERARQQHECVHVRREIGQFRHVYLQKWASHYDLLRLRTTLIPLPSLSQHTLHEARDHLAVTKDSDWRIIVSTALIIHLSHSIG